MLLYNARTKNQGFTLVETLTVVIVIGILSAIAAPSFLSMFSKNKVNDALTQVRGALQEAQREAMRKSKTCKVNIPKGNDKTISSDPSDCLITGNRTLKDININHDKAADPWVITFDFKGRTNDVDNNGTLILSASNTSAQKCLVVSQGIGMVRTGNYDATKATDKCETSR